MTPPMIPVLNWKKISALILLCIPLLLTPAQEKKEERVTEITSDKLLFDYAKKVAVFTGNVVVVDPDMQMTADQMTIYLTDDDEIERIESIGNVEIKMQGLHSSSGKAVYTILTGKVELSEEPQVSREGSIMQADAIIYWRLEDRMETKGNTRVIMFNADGENGRDIEF